MVAADRDRGTEPFVGMVRRHPHVDDRDIRLVLGDRRFQRLGVADRGGDLVPAVREDLGQARPDHGGVLGDDDAHARALLRRFLTPGADAAHSGPLMSVGTMKTRALTASGRLTIA